MIDVATETQIIIQIVRNVRVDILSNAVSNAILIVDLKEGNMLEQILVRLALVAMTSPLVIYINQDNKLILRLKKKEGEKRLNVT